MSSRQAGCNESILHARMTSPSAHLFTSPDAINHLANKPELYLEWVLEAWYDGVTKDNVINSFKACGIGAIGGADDHLIHCMKKGNGIPNGMYELNKAREAAEAQELVEILAGFEIEAPEEDDTGHVSEVEVIDDESAASDEENSDQEDVNHNLSDDSDFYKPLVA